MLVCFCSIKLNSSCYRVLKVYNIWCVLHNKRVELNSFFFLTTTTSSKRKINKHILFCHHPICNTWLSGTWSVSVRSSYWLRIVIFHGGLCLYQLHWHIPWNKVLLSRFTSVQNETENYTHTKKYIINKNRSRSACVKSHSNRPPNIPCLGPINHVYIHIIPILLHI